MILLTFGRPADDIDSLRMLCQGGEILDFAVFSIAFDLPDLYSVSTALKPTPGTGTAATYSNIVVSTTGREPALSVGLKMCRVHGGVLLVPVDDQRRALHLVH